MATGLVEAQIKAGRAEHDAKLVAFWAKHDAKILAIEARSEAQLKAIEDASKEATRLAEAEKEAESAEDDRQVKASTEAFKEVSRLANHVTAQLKLEVKAVNDRRKYNALVAALKSNLTLADDG